MISNSVVDCERATPEGIQWIQSVVVVIIVTECALSQHQGKDINAHQSTERLRLATDPYVGCALVSERLCFSHLRRMFTSSSSCSLV